MIIPGFNIVHNNVDTDWTIAEYPLDFIASLGSFYSNHSFNFTVITNLMVIGIGL